MTEQTKQAIAVMLEALAWADGKLDEKILKKAIESGINALDQQTKQNEAVAEVCLRANEVCEIAARHGTINDFGKTFFTDDELFDFVTEVLLFTSPPTTQAYAAVMLQKAIDCYSPDDTATDYIDKIRALISTYAQVALDDYVQGLCLKVAHEVEYAPAPKSDTGYTEEELLAIVNSVIEGKKS